jgi:uncharacterized protein (DUF2252 family)
MMDIAGRIQLFNSKRNSDLVQQKYRLMAANAFSFYRGTCHLFYQDWPRETPLNNAPTVWISGDLHLENFGSYRGDNRLVYFDINDFDEAVLAPCTWELARLLTSVLLSNLRLGINDAQAARLGQLLVHTYAQTLAKGQVFHVERATSTGLIHQLLYSLKKRSHKTFLAQYTVKRGNQYRLRADNNRTVALPADEYGTIKTLLENWQQKQHMPPFTEVIDVARHVAGLGSLGLPHYIILVQAKSTANSNFLLTLKEEAGSSLEPYAIIKQPHWRNEAERVITCQRRLQAVSPAMHHAVTGNGKSYILREFQAENQRVKIDTKNGKFSRIEKLITTLAKITAWDHLRSAGHQGASLPDVLIAFGERPDWQSQILSYAQEYAIKVKADHAEFKAAQTDWQKVT